jgi:hypothetical protein
MLHSLGIRVSQATKTEGDKKSSTASANAPEATLKKKRVALS